MNTLHIHAQQHWHDDAWIVGDRVSLQALRDAIDVALKEGNSSCEAFVCDGEGFVTIIICADPVEHNAAVPYTSEEATEKNDKAIWPHLRLSAQDYQALTKSSASSKG